MSFVSESFCLKEDYGPKDQAPDQASNGLLKKYLNWLDENPLQTRCMTFAVVGAIGSMLGARTNPKRPRKGPTIDWLEVISFTLHGGLVAGPLSHYLNEFLDENFYDSPSQAVLVDQIIAQPPQLFLMLAFIEMSRAAISSLPSAISRSSSLLGASVADSWKFWPLSVYLLRKALRKRKHYVAAINLCSIAWVAHLAKRRSRRSNP